MRKIIYTKYSNDRDKQYNIKTRIEEDETGNRYVRKYSDSQESSKHILKIYDNYKKLSDIFRDDGIIMNKCDLIDESCIEYQYIKGISFEEYIAGSNNKSELIENIINILDKHATLDFEIGQDFLNYFGADDYSCLYGKKSMRYSNLDILFTNLLVDADCLVNIDYEWVVDFLVPVDFIIFRTLFYSSCDEAKGLLENSYRFSERDIEVYKKMDNTFQNSVMNKHKYLGQMYDEIRINTFGDNFVGNEDEYIKILDDNRNKKLQIEVLNKVVVDMNNSMSFRITKPLRKINRILRGKK